MLVSALITELLREWSETDDDADKNALLLSWIKNALDEFALITDLHEFHENITITTIASTPQYIIAANMRDIVAMRMAANNQPIEERSLQELQLSYADLEATGTPRFWYRNNINTASNSAVSNIIWLYPVPDAIYSINAHCLVHPSTITTASVIPVHNQHIAVIKEKVRCFMKIDEKDYEAANMHDQKFLQMAGLVIKRNNKSPALLRKLRVTDVPSSREEFVRPDPTHFARQ
jgi:hypothetical protein